MAVSALLHVAIVAAPLSVARDAGSVIPARTSRTLTFVRMLPAPDPARLVPRAPLRLPPVVKEQPKIIEAARVEIEAPPIPDRVMTRVEPKPPAPEPRRENPIAPERPRPAPPAVTVGTFALNATSARASEPSRSLQPAEFDAPAARAPEIQTVSAAVGAFEQPRFGGRPQPGTDRPNVAADAGFGTATAAVQARPAARALAAGGFDASRGDAGRGAQPPQAVKVTDFDARVPPPAAPQAPRQQRVDVPLEILSKPTPTYTDEARALKVEGEVLLEVEFTAMGEIRVLRVARGLGHGLDESAARAVQGMRFKPAQSNGRPIDVRTTVRIVFRMA
jgi:TonB family protein